MKLSDTRILQHLRQNSRTNLTTISRKTGIPVSTIFDKIRAYEDQFVQKFTVLVDFSKLGYSVRAKIFLKVEPQQREKLKGYLIAHDRVNNIFRINNGFDFAIDCIFVSIKEVEEFVETLELQFVLMDKHVFHIIDDIAREKVFTELN
jgi:Lrp/AsnC family transcriptional regulator, regulator for asnA, asnC and gidA